MEHYITSSQKAPNDPTSIITGPLKHRVVEVRNISALKQL
jgi:hypothetical protein